MRNTAIDIVEFKEELLKNLKVLVDDIPMFVPANDIDKKILTIGLDMLSTLKTDIENAKTIGELSRYIDIGKIEDDWEQIKTQVMNINSSEVRIALSDVVDKLIDEEDNK